MPMISDNSLTPCGDGYEVTLSACPVLSSDKIHVNTGLPDGDYFWFIEDKFGNLKFRAITIADGLAEIILSDFPAGSFTPFGGHYKLWFTDGVYSGPLEITIDGNPYEYILMDFRESNVKLLTI